MSFDYTRPLATARRLIVKFGQLVTFTRIDNLDGYDAQSGESFETITTFTANAVVLPGSSSAQDVMNPSNFMIEGSLIRDAENYALVEVNSAGDQPQPADKVTFGGDDWRIIDVYALAPAGLNVMFSVALERA
jgi:hypothetical protein